MNTPDIRCPGCGSRIPNRPDMDSARCGSCGASLLRHPTFWMQIVQAIGALCIVGAMFFLGWLLYTGAVEGLAAVAVALVLLAAGLWVKAGAREGK